MHHLAMGILLIKHGCCPNMSCFHKVISYFLYLGLLKIKTRSTTEDVLSLVTVPFV